MFTINVEELAANILSCSFIPVSNFPHGSDEMHTSYKPVEYEVADTWPTFACIDPGETAQPCNIS